MKRTVLGFYLSERIAQVLALEQDGSSNSLRAIAEWESTLFNYAGDDTPGVDEFVERLGHFLSSNDLVPQQVSVALDSSLLFINTIPGLDSTADIDEQLQWELNEYFPGSPRDSFITDTHAIKQRNGQKQGTLIMVSARRDVVQKLHRSLPRVNLGLDIVDVDHFSAETALRFNFPETGNKFIALIGIKEQRIDLSLIRYDEIESYSYVTITSDKDLEQLVGRISKEAKGLSSICAYGTHLNKEHLSRMRSASGIPVEALNPFRSVDIASSVRLKNDPTPASYRYAAAVGAALRKD